MSSLKNGWPQSPIESTPPNSITASTLARPCLGPVHVLEVEPERELVERQRGGAAVQHGVEFRERVIALTRAVLFDVDQPEIPAPEESGDPEDEVMEVLAAGGQVVKRADAVRIACVIARVAANVVKNDTDDRNSRSRRVSRKARR